tara:strand:- start:671 stop:1144 length:474 start_codon:yes stop_codon:yes gene_type:complete
MMIKIKKLIPIFLIMILLNNCGYTPKYAVNKNVNFTIDLIEFTGDREFNNFLKSKLIRYKKNKDSNKKNYKLNLNTEYKKNIKSRDSTGSAEKYELVIIVNAIVQSELIEPKKLIFEEKFIMNKFEDAFEEKNYEKTIKENFSDLILDRIIFYLFKL